MAVVRTADAPLARPYEFAQRACRDLSRSWPLAIEMARRDIRSQHRQSVLGVAVVVLPVLVMTGAALGFRRAGILTVDGLTIPYGLFVLSGVVLWITFIDALNAPIQGLLAEQRILARTSSLAEGVIIAKLGQVLFHAGIRLVVLAAAVPWYDVAVPGTVILAPFGLIGLIALGTAIGLVLAPINLVYRDVSKMLVAITTIWFFLSPVYFPPPADGAIGAVMRMNPVTPLLAGTRALALTGRVVDPLYGLFVALAVGVLLMAGWIWFRVSLPIAIERGGD
jgi:lipopolysaccharide transport system permease protein